MTKILITGANGFVGRAIIPALINAGHDVIAATRAEVGAIDGHTDWRGLLKGVAVVIHLAARAHVPHRKPGSTIDWYRKVNTEGTLNLAEQAVNAGVSHFIFFSSIGVTGSNSESAIDGVITEDAQSAPANDYAQSKLEAERKLLSLFASADSRLSIIRPPLIYGASAPGNFARLLKLADTPAPLPFGKVDNRRTMLSLENLKSFIVCAVANKPTEDRVYIVADDEAVSIAQLIKLLRRGLKRAPRLLPVPVKLMELAARVLGKQAMFEQLCGNLQVSNSRAKVAFSWQPVSTAEDALQQCAHDYNNRGQK